MSTEQRNTSVFDLMSELKESGASCKKISKIFNDLKIHVDGISKWDKKTVEIFFGNEADKQFFSQTDPLSLIDQRQIMRERERQQKGKSFIQ